jgi:general secretion pathway protein F
MKYRYTALAVGQTTVEGRKEADTADDVAQFLRRQGLIPLRIETDRQRFSLRTILTKDIRLGPQVSANELTAILYELGGLLGAGVPLNEAMQIIGDGRSKPQLRSFVGTLHESIKGGAGLSDALAKTPREVPAEVVAVVRAGEASGSLGATVGRLAADLQQRQKQASEFRKALIYPIILAMTALVVVLVLFLVVVPQLEGLFLDDARERLPIVAQSVLAVSQWLRTFGSIFAITAGLIIVGVGLALRISAVAFARDRVILSAPLVGKVLKAQAYAQFLRLFASLLQGGVKTERSLSIAAATLKNKDLRGRFENLHQKVVEGQSLSEAMTGARLMGQDVVSIMRVGERTGQLATMMDRAATLYEDRAKTQLQLFVTLAGPILTALLGFVAAIVAYAVLSTLLSVNELAFQ